MFRRIGWQVLLVGIGFLIAAGMLFYMASTYTTEYRPAPGGTYVESVSGYPRSLNPLLTSYNDADSDVTALAFNGLTRMTMQGEVAPDLAQRWEIASSGITYTFYLDPQALWHDGTPVSTDDVVFTVGLLQDPDYPGPPHISQLWQTVEVQKVDDLTVQFILSQPYAPFLDYTTIGLLPAHLLSGTAAAELPTLEYNRAPVGTGPYRVADVVVAEGQITEVTFKRFQRYYGLAPYLENIVLRFYPTDRAALEAYERGQVEGIGEVPPELLPQAWEQEDLRFYTAPQAEMAMLYFNELLTDTVPFAETKARQALFYSLDRQALIDELLLGQAIAPETPLLPGTWAYDTEDVRAYDYDPELARQLFDQAGWVRPESGGILRSRVGQPLRFSLLVANEPQEVALGQAIADQWARQGVSVTVEAVPPLVRNGALESRDYEAALVHVRLSGDPDPYPFWHETQYLTGQNYAGFRHRRISEVIEAARITINREERKQLYREFQQLFMEEVPAFPLYVPAYTHAVDAQTQGVQIGPLISTGDRFRNVADWYVLQRRVIVSEQE
jgi:peptide/nickel transport system substrate-binding protein